MGLGLWNYVIISVALELSILLIGSVFYFKSKNPDSGPIAKYGMLLLIIFQIFLAIISPFMPDAPNVMAFVISTLFSLTLLTLIAFWLDGKRTLSNTNNS